jgi:hypothetical protein
MTSPYRDLLISQDVWSTELFGSPPMPGIDVTEARSAIANDPVNILSSGGDSIPIPDPMEVVTWHPEALMDLSN